MQNKWRHQGQTDVVMRAVGCRSVAHRNLLHTSKTLAWIAMQTTTGIRRWAIPQSAHFPMPDAIEPDTEEVLRRNLELIAAARARVKLDLLLLRMRGLDRSSGG